MAAQYDLYRINEIGGEPGKENMRARFVSKGTISTRKMTQWIEQTSGFNHGQAEGLITCLTDAILEYLEDGYEVQLGELGYFSISLTSRPVESKKELRSESVCFKGLKFRPAAKVRRRLTNIRTERVATPVAKSIVSTREERAGILREFLTCHSCISRKDYAQITSLLKGKAISDLKAFMKEGWLEKYGVGNAVVYLLK